MKTTYKYMADTGHNIFRGALEQITANQCNDIIQVVSQSGTKPTLTRSKNAISSLRTHAHTGATIVMHVRNCPFYNSDIVNSTFQNFNSNFIMPVQPTEVIEGYIYKSVKEKYVITDGERSRRIQYA
jgi:hypothetical protein